jgi:hypothetical protein
MPTFGELLRFLNQEFHVTRKKSTMAVVGPRGDVDMHYLERHFENGQILLAAVQDHHDGQMLHPNVVRSICRQLHIPPEALKFKAGESWPAPSCPSIPPPSTKFN